MLFKQLILKHLEDAIETTKGDYGSYDKAINYVQEQRRKHQEKVSPAPMDIGSIEHNDNEHKQERDSEHTDNQDEHGAECPLGSFHESP